MRCLSVVRYICVGCVFVVSFSDAVFAQGAVEGTATFWGDPGSGTQIQVAAHLDPTAPPDATVLVSMPGGSYSIPVPDGSYYIATLVAQDDVFGQPRPEDVLVWYDADSDGNRDFVTVSSGSTVTGVDIDLGFVYVDIDAAGGGDGSSWALAFNDLQSGMDLAVPGVDVWVAEGTYLPFPGTSRTEGFQVRTGVRVYGGFTGAETMRTERDWNAHPTILSGEIGDPGTTADNAYNVVKASFASPTAVLDGFTITAGRADGGPSSNYGAGVLASGGGVTLVNATVSGNFASTYGGGVAAVSGGAVNAYNTSFVNNTAQTFDGGGYYADIAADLPHTQNLVNCVFTGNSGVRGGGIALTGFASPPYEPVMVNLSLSGNEALDGGGGLHTNSSQSIVFSNSIFWGNTSPVDAQIAFLDGTMEPTVNYGIVQGGWGTGSSVFDVDPSFVGSDDLRLNNDSPAIDAGDSLAVPLDEHDADGDHMTDGQVLKDRDFNPRFIDIVEVPDTGNANFGEPVVDMGAYEKQGLFLFADGFESGDTTAWSSVAP